MKGKPPVAVGPLKSKPTWFNTCWVFNHVGFLFSVLRHNL